MSDGISRRRMRGSSSEKEQEIPAAPPPPDDRRAAIASLGNAGLETSGAPSLSDGPARPFVPPEAEAELPSLAGKIPMPAIAAHFGVSAITVYKWGRALGLRFGYRKPS